MSTKREGILAAAKAALTGVTGIADSHVFRSRVVAFARDACPALVIEPINDTPDEPNIHRLQWNLTFQVAVIYRTDGPDIAADATIESVHSKIMNAAAVLSLVNDLRPGPCDWQLVDADKPMGAVTMQFKASYQTDVNTISA
jgi:hypothetical protein